MWLIWKCMFTLMSVVTSQSCSESKEVYIDQGRLRGFRYSGGHFFTFMSVPYATAPTGKDRFKAPLPAPVWMQTFDAVETGKVCPQPQPLPKIQEDCLVANIFVPDTNVTNLPVMVYIHSGAYIITSGDFFRYTKLVETKEVIVVTFNYRLGVHGFLCLGTEDVPGNAGMKDQVALLRWVQRNIRSFGGNPDNVTVAGCSAAGVAIELLTLSPMATGLFHKAIIEGGSSLTVFGVQIDPIENAKVYARALNFSHVENITALEEFYKTASYELLTSQTENFVFRDDSTSLFGPCVENDIRTGEKIILKPPLNILLQGNYKKLPLLYGFSDMEGIKSRDFFEYRRDKMNDRFANFLPGDLKFGSHDEKEDVAQNVKKFYFGEKEVCEETILNYITYFTDIAFNYPMLRGLSMRQKAGNATVYLFEYTFLDENAEYVPYTDIRGAGHCSLVRAVMDEDLLNKTNEYRAMKTTVRALWLNFMKIGQPVPEESSFPKWPPVNDNKWSPYMALNHANPELKTFLSLEGRIKFWDKIYQTYYRFPIPPTNGSISYKLFSINITFIISYCILYIDR